MTQEDKKLLLADLCGRLSYGVKGRVYAECSKGEYDINGDMIFFDSPFDVTLDDINISTEEIHVIAIGNEDTVDFIEDQQTWGNRYIVDEFKPYLRPMSSMTEEEKKRFIDATDGELRYSEVFDVIKPMRESEDYCASFVSYLKSIDWLNAHHFDYRGLIEKNLALDCTGLHIYD